MSQDKSRAGGVDRTDSWVHLGASGVLQPLGEAFLYCSPTRRAGLACLRPRHKRERYTDADI